MSIVNDTMELLTATARKHRAVAVAYSDGKDARTVLDLAIKAGFERVEPYFMYLVPGLEVVEKRLAEAEARYPGIMVHQLPNVSAIQFMKDATYCDPPSDLNDLPDMNLQDIYRLIMDDLKVTLVLTGEKASDSMRRRLLMKRGMNTWEEVMWPIRYWNTHDVMAYLAMRKIPIPKFGCSSTRANETACT